MKKIKIIQENLIHVTIFVDEKLSRDIFFKICNYNYVKHDIKGRKQIIIESQCSLKSL